MVEGEHVLSVCLVLKRPFIVDDGQELVSLQPLILACCRIPPVLRKRKRPIIDIHTLCRCIAHLRQPRWEALVGRAIAESIVWTIDGYEIVGLGLVEYLDEGTTSNGALRMAQEVKAILQLGVRDQGLVEVLRLLPHILGHASHIVVHIQICDVDVWKSAPDIILLPWELFLCIAVETVQHDDWKQFCTR